MKPGDLVTILKDYPNCSPLRAGEVCEISSPDFSGATVRGGDGRVWSLDGENFALLAARQYDTVPLKIKRLDPEAVMPSYAKLGDAGMDLTVIDDGKDIWPPLTPEAAYLYREYRTGLAMEIPTGFVGLIFPRSSQSNTGLILANCVGVIDSGYRGEVKFRFKLDAAGFVLKGSTGVKAYVKGDRAGQLIILPVPQVAVEEVTELSETERGDGGFGSSGK